MGKGQYPGWRDYTPARVVGGTLPGFETPPPPPAPAARGDATAANKSRDRGSRQGAKWYVVTDDLNLYVKKLADEHGIKGTLFRSGKEAKRWISLRGQESAGIIRGLRRQVRYPLCTVRQDGLIATVCNYVADFVYEEQPAAGGWVEVVEDTKPGGTMMKKGKARPFREEIYLLKRKWFAAQYGREIRES